ncbi:hypothetical protein IQ26_02470 [Mesorhizobium tianshanense]|uniref:Uncharacterized protein n=1 Tax=Mesorhizobium tianshanense TaxID=39844 RepID=A0A562NZD2_9HYPH|nr:hypothetical protein IQ26_02470 [Mesorhizobium tianshanense]
MGVLFAKNPYAIALRFTGARNPGLEKLEGQHPAQHPSALPGVRRSESQAIGFPSAARTTPARGEIGSAADGLRTDVI